MGKGTVTGKGISKIVLIMCYFDDYEDDNPTLSFKLEKVKKDMNATYGITNITNYVDMFGREIHIGDWIRFLFWLPSSNGLQRECYRIGRILKRRGKLVFRYRDDFSMSNKGFHEHRLDALKFDSMIEWEKLDNIRHYGAIKL